MRGAFPIAIVAALLVGSPGVMAGSEVQTEGTRQQLRTVTSSSPLVGSPAVTVAVLDTGITAHPDLGWRLTADAVGRPGGAILPGYDFISDRWSAADGDGWDPDPSDRGDGVRTGDSPVQPGCRAVVSSWHGTDVAGTIGAVRSNDRGLNGIAAGVRILPVRILGRCGGNTADVAAGLLWAAGEKVAGVPINPHPAQVINLSLSGSSDRCPRALQTAIDVATARGASVVVAAGSAGTDTRTQTPANCSGVIVVGATDREDRRSPTSNFGTEVTVSAPGGNMAVRETEGIYTTTNTGRFRPRRPSYGYYQGSSAAAAHASGVIAVLLSRRPNLDPEGVYEFITSPAAIEPFQPGQCDAGDGRCGLGILRLDRVLAATQSGQ